jgi:hypothetical protein
MEKRIEYILSFAAKSKYNFEGKQEKVLLTYKQLLSFSVLRSEMHGCFCHEYFKISVSLTEGHTNDSI